MLWTKPRLNQFFVVESSDVTLATPVPASIETVLLRGVLPGVLYTDDLATPVIMLWTKPRLNQFLVVESSDVTLATPVPASIEKVL